MLYSGFDLQPMNQSYTNKPNPVLMTKVSSNRNPCPESPAFSSNLRPIHVGCLVKQSRSCRKRGDNSKEFCSGKSDCLRCHLKKNKLANERMKTEKLIAKELAN